MGVKTKYMVSIFIQNQFGNFVKKSKQKKFNIRKYQVQPLEAAQVLKPPTSTE